MANDTEVEETYRDEYWKREGERNEAENYANGGEVCACCGCLNCQHEVA